MFFFFLFKTKASLRYQKEEEKIGKETALKIAERSTQIRNNSQIVQNGKELRIGEHQFNGVIMNERMHKYILMGRRSRETASKDLAT